MQRREIFLRFIEVNVMSRLIAAWVSIYFVQNFTWTNQTSLIASAIADIAAIIRIIPKKISNSAVLVPRIVRKTFNETNELTKAYHPPSIRPARKAIVHVVVRVMSCGIVVLKTARKKKATLGFKKAIRKPLVNARVWYWSSFFLLFSETAAGLNFFFIPSVTMDAPR